MSEIVIHKDRFKHEIGVPLYQEKPSSMVPIIMETIRKGTVVNKVNDFNLYNVLIANITKVYADLKQHLPGQKQLDYDANGVINLMRKKKLNIRDTEIILAFENGIHGMYGEYFGINVVSLFKFITEYSKSDTDRTEALRQLNAPVEEEKREPSIPEKFIISKKNALDGYRMFLKSQTVDHYGAVIFDFFYKIRLIIVTQEEIDDVMQRGSDLHFYELKRKSAAKADTLLRKEVENQIAAFLDKMVEDNHKPDGTNPLVVLQAKRIYIEDLYRGFSLDEMTVEALEREIYEHFDLEMLEQLEIEEAKAKQKADGKEEN